jgi:hypothetical protein
MRFTSLLTACLGLSLVLDVSRSSGVPLNKIQLENRQPGTTAWQLTNPADARQIEGYASLTSVPVGGDIDLFVNTPDKTYSLVVYRMGWYGGAGGRKVFGPLVKPGVRQVTPTVDPTTEVIDCHWTNPVKIHVPTSWLSGIYLVKLHANTSGRESYIIFTVRDTRHADLVFQQSVNTYQAYNPWPGYDTVAQAYTGQSLYDFETKNFAQAKQVSFNRPYGLAERNFGSPEILYSHSVSLFYGIGAGDFLHNIAPAAMDFGLVRWLEHQGYDVTYITDVDTHEDVGNLLRGKAYLSGGHDEYVTREMKTNIVQARDQGVSLGFFGANYIYWPVQLLPDSSGTPDRILSLFSTCLDPAAGTCSAGPECTADGDCPAGQSCVVKKCDYAHSLDSSGQSETEQLVAGGMWDPGAAINGGGDIIVRADAHLDHWVFANTGLAVGDVIPGIVGSEYNAVISPEFLLPAGHEILLETQAPNFGAGNPGFLLPDGFDGKDFDGWYDAAMAAAAANSGVYWQPGSCESDPSRPCFTDQDCATGDRCAQFCDTSPIPPLNRPPLQGYCRNPFPYWPGRRFDWAMTIYQASSGAWVFNVGTNEWAWGLDDYFTGLKTPDKANNGPALRIRCGYPWFHPGLVSCRNPAIEQITRNVLNRFINP